jgi:flavin reductase (DIM6/NTAB) family NADH-FMN oxidoreductase RutF
VTEEGTGFREIAPESIKDNVFKLIDKDWMLITAGTIDAWNTMTASWGGLGILWNKSVAFCFVRPTRHTYGFMEKHDRFTLSFFEEEWRDALNLCGTRSGRDTDKAKETGLKPVSGAQGTVHFEQARMVLECRKLYFQDISPERFLDPSIDKNYPNKDYHRMYVGEVLRCLAR